MGAREAANSIESDHTDELAVDEDRINYPGLQLGDLNLVKLSLALQFIGKLTRTYLEYRQMLVRLQPAELKEDLDRCGSDPSLEN